MQTDRRGFLRALGGAVAFVAGAGSPAEAAERVGAMRVHRATRNTRLGAVGQFLSTLGPDPPTFKPDTGASRHPLLPVAPARGETLEQAVQRASAPADFAAGAISRESIARLLFLSNGVTDPREGASVPLRAAPSAGARYAGEVYLVVDKVDGYEPGVYRYDVVAHDLVQLSLGSALPAVADALDRPGVARDAAAAVLLTNVFGRYTGRYANRGYRYALIDSGHIGENLRLAAVSMALTSRLQPRFQDDSLNGLLGLNGSAEAVCAVHLVGVPVAWPGEATAREPRLVERSQTGEGEGEGSLPIRYHHGSGLVPGVPAVSANVPSNGEADREPGQDAWRGPSVEKPQPWHLDLEGAIRRRRSARHFEQQPVSREDLDFVVRMACGDGELQREAELLLLLFAHRVDGLSAGLYRVDPATAELELQRPGDQSRALVRACLRQGKAGDAAVGFATAGRIAEAVDRRGERSYRDLLVASGAIAQRIYLAAESRGLAARNLAAFFDDDLNRLVDLDGQRDAVLHLTMMGPGD